MSSADGRSGDPRLVVTGVDGAIARAVLRSLRDRFPGTVEASLRTARSDRRHPGEADEPSRAAGADTVVLVALSTDLADDLARGPARRDGLRDLVGAAICDVRPGGHLVVVTSARVYGARSDNPVPLDEDDPRRARDDDSVTGDLLLVERGVDRLAAARPDMRVTFVRPAAVVGPGVDTTITRHFEPPRLLVVHGSDPVWQFCHLDDLVEAVGVVVEQLLGPVVTVAADGWLSQRRVEEISGKRRIELPVGVVTTTARRLHAVGALSDPGADLDYVRYPWVVPSTRLRAAGWSPRHDNETCFGALLDAIRTDRALVALRRDTAVGTASAAVALVGTAALLRRRRKGGRR